MSILLGMHLVFTAAAFGADYDIVVRNGRVVDGSSNAWYRADIGIRGGRIAKIGRLDTSTAERVIDASNNVVAPGFIDVHTHVESGIDAQPAAANFLLDGVTTIITGNCGGSRIDVAKLLSDRSAGVNFATFIGHNTVRREVMGTANRAPTVDELQRMQALVTKAMADGAVGFSSGLEYIPGAYSATPELIALAKMAAPFGGVYASHMRDEDDHVIEAIDEAAQIGKEAQVPVEISHLKQCYRSLWGMAGKMLDRIDEHRRNGIDVVADAYPYEAYSTGLSIMIPTWALADGQEAIHRRMNDPVQRKKIVAEMKEMIRTEGQPDYQYAREASCSFDPGMNGKTIREIAESKRRKGLDGQIDTIFEMQQKGGASLVFTAMGADDVEKILQHPFVAIASDGGIVEMGKGLPHPRSYGTNARVLGMYVRERRSIGLDDAIRKMTSLPARTFALKDRGLLREGYWADITILDAAVVSDKATFTAPHQYSKGFAYVLVNGKIAVDKSAMTTTLGGRALRMKDGLTQ